MSSAYIKLHTVLKREGKSFTMSEYWNKNRKLFCLTREFFVSINFSKLIYIVNILEKGVKYRAYISDQCLHY